MSNQQSAGPDLSTVVGNIPYRLALAGGWIDQPFVSKLNPTPPGSMVTVCIHPTVRFMERAGMATGTRRVAKRLWGDRIPDGDRTSLVRTLYAEENRNLTDPSGSQDMIGLIYPGVCRLDYDFAHEGGYFPRSIETCVDPQVARWIERVMHIIPVAPRPAGYSPLGINRVTSALVQQLSQAGRQCYDALVGRDLKSLGQSMNDCMRVWAEMLPHVVEHELLEVDLRALLKCYQARYPGAMYSGCGGGYLYVVSEEPVPGAFQISVKTQ